MLSRIAISQEQKPISTRPLGRQLSHGRHGMAVDRRRLLEEIESATQNSDGRLKAIEVC